MEQVLLSNGGSDDCARGGSQTTATRAREVEEHVTYDAPRRQKAPPRGARPGTSLGPKGVTAVCGIPQKMPSRPSACRYWLGVGRGSGLLRALLPHRPQRWRPRGRRRRRQRGGRSRTQRKQRGWSSGRWSPCLGRTARPSRRAGSMLSPGSFLRPLRPGGRGRRGGKSSLPRFVPPPRAALASLLPLQVHSSVARAARLESGQLSTTYTVLCLGVA